MLNQDYVNQLYQQVPETAEEAELRLKQLPYSGLALVNKINPGESVIDIGCGHHIFKKYIANIIGIDPVYRAADYVVPLQDFKTDQRFNVAFCLGSLNHGSNNEVVTQISNVINLLTPTARIYWRFNIDPTPSKYKYPWSVEQNQNFATQFGFILKDYAYELVANTRKKLYAEWIR